MSGFTVNVVVQSGNLTRDPELRSLPSGMSVCQLGLAVNERYKDSNGEWQDRPNYFDWTVWGGMGEWVAKNLSRGDGVTLEGRARWRTWENDQGDKRSAIDFTADSIVPQRKGGGGQTARDKRMENEDAYNPHATNGKSDVPGAAQGEFEHPPAEPVASAADDDIPF